MQIVGKNKKMKLTIASLLLIPALFLAGCEDDDSSSNPPPETNEPPAETTGTISPDPVDTPQPDVDFEPGTVLVGFKQGKITVAEADIFFGAYGLQYRQLLSDPASDSFGIAVVSVPVGTEWQWVRTFIKRDIVAYAELNEIVSEG